MFTKSNYNTVKIRNRQLFSSILLPPPLSECPSAIKEDVSDGEAFAVYKLLTMTVNLNFFVFSLYFAAVFAAPTEECDKSKCKGPLRFYTELSCTPVYKNPSDCCPYKYKCDNLKDRSADKCYINGHEYNIGEELRDEDKNPCDLGCVCRKNEEIAQFVCAIVDCFTPRREGCYNLQNATQCCAESPVCPEKEEDWPTCVVDGKTYKAGHYFSPIAEPKRDCYCGPGYTDENIDSFCKPVTTFGCGTELRYSSEIQNNCAPVYYKSAIEQNDCPISYKCETSDDEVIRQNSKSDSSESKSSDSKSSESSEENTEDMCKLGNLTMRIGDELKKNRDYGSICVKCVCEVPPTPTCRQLPESLCNIAKSQ